MSWLPWVAVARCYHGCAQVRVQGHVDAAEREASLLRRPAYAPRQRAGRRDTPVTRATPAACLLASSRAGRCHTAGPWQRAGPWPHAVARPYRRPTAGWERPPLATSLRRRSRKLRGSLTRREAKVGQRRRAWLRDLRHARLYYRPLVGCSWTRARPQRTLR